MTLLNKDGSLKRQFRISGEEQDAINRGVKNYPDSVTEAEWIEGMITASRPCNPGQGFINVDGSMVVNYGVADDGIESKKMIIPPDKWAIENDKVAIDSSITEVHNIEK